MSIYLKILRVVWDENIFIFFQNGDKTAGSAQKIRVGRVSGNTSIIFFGPTGIPIDLKFHGPVGKPQSLKSQQVILGNNNSCRPAA